MTEPILKMGPVALGRDYRGASWDIGIYFLPGILIAIALFAFNSGIFKFWIDLLLKSSAAAIILLICISYVMGHGISAISGLVSRIINSNYREKYFKEALNNEVFKKAIIDFIFQGIEENFRKFSETDLYFLCNQFVRTSSLDAYNLYISRQYLVAEMRFNIGVSFGIVGVLAVLSDHIGLWPGKVLFCIGGIIACALMLLQAISDRKHQITSTVRAVLICGHQTKQACREA